MGWSGAFLSQIASGRVSLSFAVETFRDYLDGGVGSAGTVWTTGGTHKGAAVLLHDSIQVGGQSVGLQSWSYGSQAWSFVLATPAAGVVEQVLRRGTWLRLRAGPAGWDYGAWEIIQSGRVASVRRLHHGAVQVVVWDLVSSLRQRNTDNVDEAPLFYDAARSATIATTAYTAGAATLTLSSVAYAKRIAGGTGAVLVDADSGSPFYLTFTGISGAQLTGVSATGQWGTTASAAAIGNSVYGIPYLYNRPDQIVARILASSGAGTNGTYDVLPKDWGYALTDTTIVDTSDIVLDWGNAVLGATSGTYRWDAIVTAKQYDGLGWLGGLLQVAGLWLCQRQGVITLRGAQDPENVLHACDVEIADDAIVAGVVDWYDPGSASEYYGLNLEGATVQVKKASTQATSLPANGVAVYDLSDRLLSNESAVLTEIADRVWPWMERVAEVVEVTLAGLWWSQLTVGDMPTLTSTQLRGRLKSTCQGYSGRRVMVLDVRPGWTAQQPTTVLRLGVAPVDDADEWVS